MIKSESIKNLSVALIAAQVEMRNPVFDAKNPHFRSKYASLKSVREAVMPVLNKHGLGVTQLIGFIESGDITCETLLIHTSGEYIGSECSIKTKQDAHGAGSAITYARRYSLQAIVGVVGDDDDDGNGALPTPDEFVTADQVKEISALIAETDSDNEKFWKFAKADTVDTIKSKNYQMVAASLKAKALKATGRP